MDKRTVIAVVLAVVVIIGMMIVQSVFFPPEEPTAQQATQPGETSTQPIPEMEAEEAVEAPVEGEQPAAAGGNLALVAEEGIEEENFTIETEVFRIGFTNRGGEITSIELKEFSNIDGSPVEMIFAQDSGVNPFSLHFGDADAPAVEDLFKVERSLVGKGVTFSRTFSSQTGVPFTLKKSCLLYTSPSPRDRTRSRMPSSA